MAESERLAQLEEENRVLRDKVERLEEEIRAMREEARSTIIFDDINPDDAPFSGPILRRDID